VLEEYKEKGIKGVMHCFPGNLDDAKKAIDYGLMLGVGGVSTFKNTHLREVLKEIDIKNIVLETDSPYLAPVPFRGKRNESAYVVNIADMLSGLYAMDIKIVGEITSANAKRLFNF
jgi:TatD DNase family protein